MYCLENWGNAAKIYLDSIIKLQKKIVRMISYASFREHTPPLFKDLQILTLNNMFIFQILVFMFKVSNSKVPSQIKEMFIRYDDAHEHETRNTFKFRLPFMRLSKSQNSIRFIGPKLWNIYIKKIKFKPFRSIYTFKNIVKKYLLALTTY